LEHNKAQTQENQTEQTQPPIEIPELLQERFDSLFVWPYLLGTVNRESNN
jgi:hypothetical protein